MNGNHQFGLTSPITDQQSYMLNDPMTSPPKTLCGPFDMQFRRKFLGSRSNSMDAQRLKLFKNPSGNINRYSKSLPKEMNMLPKLKQIEKIVKAEGRKHKKVNKYVDGVSDLELYITKKLVNNFSTRQIVSKIAKNNTDQFQNRKIVTDNYLRMTVASPQTHKFHQISPQIQKQTEQNTRMSKTQYSTQKKWVSDRQFMQKFGKFIIQNHDEDATTTKEVAPQNQQISQQQAIRQIKADKSHLTKIVRQMIAQQCYDEEQEVGGSSNDKEVRVSSLGQEQPRDINWIIRECSQFENKFKVRKSKSKSKKGAKRGQ